MLECDPTAVLHIRNRAIGPLSDQDSYLSSRYTISSSVSARTVIKLDSYYFSYDAPGLSLRSGRGVRGLGGLLGNGLLKVLLTEVFLSWLMFLGYFRAQLKSENQAEV